LIPVGSRRQTFGDLSLACFQLASYLVVHSKTLRDVQLFLVCYLNKRTKPTRVFEFFRILQNTEVIGLRLNKD
jgi:hypothetical protein